MKRILLFLLFLYTSTQAAIFDVKSNADSGADTFRSAILAANANGATITDVIRFDIPGISAADVTIVLLSELPILTSNIIIDGTTQPTSLLGNPNIRIRLFRGGTTYFSGLRLDNARNIEIYGISFNNFKSDPTGPLEDKKGGIYLKGSADVIIGAVNKPNCFTGNYAGILSPFIIPRVDVQNVKISANIFGLNEDGLSLGSNESGIDLSFLKNSVIGGDNPAEGNIITNNLRNGIALGGSDGDIKIANNIIGLDKTMIKSISSNSANGIYINGETVIPKILNNYICSQKQGILLDFANGGFVVAGNRIGTGLTGNENFGNETGIHVNFCNKGMIGGNTDASENEIAFNKTAVLIEIAYPISILRNSFYCNSVAITYKNLPQNATITQSYIKTVTPTGASGTYLPNSTIELFFTDSCPDCQGKTWLATLPTDANGNWSYHGAINSPITSMGTNPDGATSTFSKPLIDESSASPLGVFCGQMNGSIKGIRVYDSSDIQWYDANGLPIPGANSEELIGVGAGTYYLKASQKGLCSATSAKYVIASSGNGINDVNKSIKNVYCGASNGYIKNIQIAGNLSRTWYNASGTQVGNNDDLEGQPAGEYYFVAGQGQCVITSPHYTIANVIVTYKVKSFSKTPSTCGQSNGSITITAYETDRPDSFKWFDEQNNEIANSENLSGLASGKYRLVGFGNNGCFNEILEFEIDEAPLPSINYSAMLKYISCDGKTVSTSGISIDGSTGPYTFRWYDENGNVVSNSLNISGLPPKTYQLNVIDKNNCTVVGQLLDFSLMKETKVSVPNAFTPNGDGLNDYWQIKGMQNYPFAEISVFTRNGIKIFYSVGYKVAFDGLFNKKKLQTGIYYYVIDLKSNCTPITGSLTLLR